MPEALILGSTPQAAALEKVLGTCTDWYVRAPSATPEWLTHVGDFTKQQFAEFRQNVMAWDVVIALLSSARRATEVVSLVHRLRTDLGWGGHIVAVMRDEAQADRIEATSFIGEAIADTCFGRVNAHDVWIAPVRLAEVLALLEDYSRYVVDDWYEYVLDAGQAGDLNRGIEEGARRLTQGEHRAARRACRDVLAKLGQIVWASVAMRDGHALDNCVTRLRSRYAEKAFLTPEDCSAIIKEAKNVLSQSAFPFPTTE
jgi:hypothetical protein